MDEATLQILKSVAGGASAAGVLAIACWKLWNALQSERDRHAAEEKALQDRIIAMYEKLTDSLKESHHD